MKNKHNIWLKLMYFGHKIGCHQMWQRSFFINGYQFPVCARCSGVLIGEFISIILILLGVKINIFISISLLLIMGFDWFIQYINLIQSNNTRRLITGLLGGIGLTFIYYNLFKLIFYRIFYF